MKKVILTIFLLIPLFDLFGQTDTIRIPEPTIQHKKKAIYVDGKKKMSVVHIVDGKEMDSTEYFNWNSVKFQNTNKWFHYYKYGDSCYIIQTGDKGKKILEGWYWSGDAPIGTIKTYFPDGTLKQISNYKLGNPNYRTILNDTTSNGKVKKKWKKEKFQSIKNGEFIEYNQKGAVVRREKYLNGIKIE